MTCQQACGHAVILLALLQCSIVQAQFRLDIQQLASANKPVEEQDFEEKVPRAQNLIQVQQNIDGWVFNQHGNATQARRFLERQLRAKIGIYTEVFGLSREQNKKLELAGQADIAAHFAAIEDIRAEFGEQVNQADFNMVWQRVQPLQMRMQRGLFTQDSIMAKVANRTLNEEQQKECQVRESERLAFAYRAAVRLTISELEKSTPFLAEQRQQIVAILDKADLPKAAGQYMNYYVLYRFAQSQQQLRGILKPGQLSALGPAFNQGQAMGQFLRQNGFID